MTKKADTWMPWYVGDYLVDTTNLNTEQHGAYCLMLMAAWKRGGSLPKDDSQLASICKLQPARWRAYKGILLEFFDDTGDAYAHGRVTKERLKAQTISDKKSANGKAGAAAKWQTESQTIPDGAANDMANAMASDMAKPMANAMAKPSQTDAPARVFSPSPSHTPSELVLEPDGSKSTAAPPTLPACPHRQLIALFAEKLPTLAKPKAELWDGKPAEAMRARWKWLLTATRSTDGSRYATNEAEALEWFGRFFDFVGDSDFLMARTGDFKCTLQWLVKAENFAKVVQGNYTNKDAA